MLTLIGSVSGHFHFALAIPSKIISAQEFTQTFALMTFRALLSLEMKQHTGASFISRAKNQGLKQQNFADQAQNFIETSRRVNFLVLVALYGTKIM